MNNQNSDNINFEEHNKHLYIIGIIAVLVAFVGTILKYFFHVPFGEWIHYIAFPIFLIVQGLILYRYTKFKKQEKNEKSI